MSLRETVQTYLQADTALMAILTGGIHVGIDISRTGTPNAFSTETQEIRPCALVKIGTEAQNGPYSTGTRAPIEIWLYERTGYTNIDAAKARLITLLDRHHFGEGVMETRLSDDLGDQAEDSLEASMSMLRFYANRIR